MRDDDSFRLISEATAGVALMALVALGLLILHLEQIAR